MPRQSGLLCRKGRYYLNIRVPTELRPLYGKKEFFRKALNTSDYHTAASEVRFEVGRVEAEFAAKRREKNAHCAKTPPPVLSELSDREAHEIVLGFFIGLEKETAEWCEDTRDYSEEKREHLLENLRVDECVYAGTSKHYEPRDGSTDLANFLKRKGIECPTDSAAFRKLRPLFRRARVESVARAIDRVEGRTVRAHEPYFRDVFADTVAPTARQFVTLGAMLTRFEQWLADAGRRKGTHRTYEIPLRILRQFIGENTSLEAVAKERIEELFKLLRRVPANATQRYRGMTLREAIEAADTRGDAHRLAAKTLKNYFNNIVAIFNFAVEKRLIAENPAKDKYLREIFERGKTTKRKEQFTTEQLTRLFRAPLYTGCRDDEHGYATPGENKPRRGRFWLPLIALFHGFRCNEVAQLYTEDVCEAEGISFFEIREERANGSECDKRLKTKQSKRRVPVHAEIIRMGFLDFVAERRCDDKHPRLFPELPQSATGYFSNPFSKWFARFLTASLGDTCKATFHSFRHAFRDALRNGDVSIEYAEALGGWGLMARSAERDYGQGPSLSRLREEIEKVKYPDLDLSHLHSVQAENRLPLLLGVPVLTRTLIHTGTQRTGFLPASQRVKAETTRFTLSATSPR